MSVSVATIRRPELPGEEFGESESRLNLKKTYLSILSLPTEDAIKYSQIPFAKLRAAISIWLLSDPELYFLQPFTLSNSASKTRVEEFESLLEKVLSMHNKRKTLSWIRNEAVIRYRILSELITTDAPSDPPSYHSEKKVLNEAEAVGGVEEIIVGQYKYRRETDLEDSYETMRINIEHILAEVETAFGELVSESEGLRKPIFHQDMNLLKDCRDFGIELFSVEPVRMPEYGGLGLIATENLQAGSVLIALEETKLVNLYQALAASFTKFDGSFNPMIDEPSSVMTTTPTTSTAASCYMMLRSESFMWAVLLGGRTVDGKSLIPANSEAHKVLTPFFAAHVPPDFYMEEQLILILYVALEALKGEKSILYLWLKHLRGYEDCEVEGGNLLISKHRNSVAQFLGENSPVGPIVESARSVEDCIRAWHEWMVKLLAPVFKDTLGAALKSSLTVERLLWATWVCESREFESPIPTPIQFFNKLHELDSQEWMNDPRVRCAFQELDTPGPYCELTVTSSSDVDDLSTLPNLQYLSQHAFGGRSKKRRLVRLPVCTGWKIDGDQNRIPVVELVEFSLSLKLLCLVPVVDFINHSETPQCPHPGFHDLESRQEISSEPMNLPSSSLCKEIAQYTFNKDWEKIKGQNLSARKFVLHTQTAVAKHDQVFINYGPHDGWSFLRYYGFTSTEAENINMVLTPDICYDKETLEYRKRQCMMEVFRLPEEHVINKNGLMNIVLAACRVLTFENIRDLLNSHSETEIHDLIYFSGDAKINRQALNLLLSILTSQPSYIYDCQKYAELCELAALKSAKPDWYRVWGDQLFRLFADRKSIVEKIICEIYDQIDDGSESENGQAD